jgi:hypothetical protein
MKRSFLRWLFASAALGLLAPVCWFVVEWLIGGNEQLEWKIAYPLERAILVLWPSSIWLMATDGIEGTSRAYLFMFMSVAGNVVLYSLLGSVAWMVNRFTGRWTRQDRLTDKWK